MTIFKVKPLDIGAITAALILLTIPFSTSIPIVLTGILLAIWLISGEFLNLPKTLKNNLIALFSVSIFIGLLIATTYSSAPFKEAISIWVKYREFLLFAILLPYLKDPRHQNWTLLAFIAGSIATLAISYVMFFNIAPRPLYAATFKSIITHSIMVALFGFFCSLQILKTTNLKNSIFWWLLLIICLHNLYFIAMGRTGQLLGVLMVLLYCFQHLNTRNSFYLLASLFVFITLFLNFSEIGFRITEGFTNVLNFDFNNPETETSMGKRLTFWKHSAALIGDSPWIGYGTGSFETEYKRIASVGEDVTKNPHNEYLLLTTQMGLLGLVLFTGFLASQYKLSLLLNNERKCLAQALLLTILITCFFNSPMLDHTEGHWFACLLAFCFSQKEKTYA